MKKFLLLTAVALLCLPVLAQRANAVFFSEFGEEFTLVINGQKQNQSPATNVRVEDIKQDFFQIRVDFADPSNEGFKANVGAEPGTESTYIIRKNRKGVYVARLHNAVPIDDAPVVDRPGTSVPAPQPEVRPAQEQVQVRTEAPSSVEQTTVITTTTTGAPQGERIGVSMQVPGVSISIDGMGVDMHMKETTTVTTTTTTTSGTSTGTLPAAEPVREEPVVRRPAIPGYSGPIGCEWPVEEASVSQMKKSIDNQSFSDQRMTVAKQATRNMCLTVNQVKEVIGLFTFEDSKLEYAKFAYDYTYDIGNYYMLNDAFTFSSSVDELNRFIERK